MTRVAPVPNGQPCLVSNNDYDAFPASVGLISGEMLVAYRHGSSHASADGKIRLRRSVDGQVWSNFYQITTPSGYSWGPTGVAADSLGRVYLSAIRYVSTGPSSAKNFYPFLFISDDDGHTWSDPTPMPVPRVDWTYPHGITVTSTGTVISAQYVKSEISGRWEAWYHKSLDRGFTWLPFGKVSIAGRDAQEPAVVQLNNGNLMSVLRSDGAGKYHDYFYATYSDLGVANWTTPAIRLEHVTGAPGVSKGDCGCFIVSYRGYETLAEDAVEQKNPMFVAVLNPDGFLTRDKIDLTAGDQRRYLYGNIVGNYLVYAVESTQETSAGIYSLPLRFSAIPEW